MRHWLHTTAAAIALAACAASASAQTAAPAPQHFGQMRQMRQQMEQIGSQARTQMLNALTPAHRTLLANLAGQLAVTTTPNFRATAQQLDSALSPSEKQAITTAETSARTQMRAAMAQARSQMSPPPGAPPRPDAQRGNRPSPSAGAILLRHAMMVRFGGERRS